MIAYRVRSKRGASPIMVACDDQEHAHRVAETLRQDGKFDDPIVEYQSTEWFTDEEYKPEECATPI